MLQIRSLEHLSSPAALNVLLKLNNMIRRFGQLLSRLSIYGLDEFLPDIILTYWLLSTPEKATLTAYPNQTVNSFHLQLSAHTFRINALAPWRDLKSCLIFLVTILLLFKNCSSNVQFSNICFGIHV